MYRGESEAAISHRPPEDKSACEALPCNDHTQAKTPAILRAIPSHLALHHWHCTIENSMMDTLLFLPGLLHGRG
jgi:hypothetical protein